MSLSELESPKLSKANFSSLTIKLVSSVLVTSFISVALTAPKIKKNIKTTEINNVVFFIEIFTPSGFSL